MTTKDDPAYPQYIVLMSNWNVAPKINETLFKLTLPPDAKKIEFIRTDVAHTPLR